MKACLLLRCCLLLCSVLCVTPLPAAPVASWAAVQPLSVALSPTSSRLFALTDGCILAFALSSPSTAAASFVLPLSPDSFSISASQVHVIASEPEQGSFLLTLNSSSLGLLSSVQLPYTQSLLSSHPTLPAVLTSILQSAEVIVIDTNGTRIAAYFLAAAPLSVLGAVIHPVSLSLYVLDANSGSVVVLSSDNELLGRLWLRSNATRLMALALSPSARFLFVLAVLDAANDTDSNQYVVEQIDVRSNETLRHWLWSVDDVTLGACIASGLSDDEFYLLDFTVSRPLRVNVSSHELVTLGRHPILRGLTSVSVDSEGEVYVCQGGTPPQVSQLTAEGDLKAVYQGVGACGYQQNVYAAVDASRRVYLTDCGGITVFNQSQAVVQTIRLPAGSAVRSIVVDSLLRLFYHGRQQRRRGLLAGRAQWQAAYQLLHAAGLPVAVGRRRGRAARSAVRRRGRQRGLLLAHQWQLRVHDQLQRGRRLPVPRSQQPQRQPAALHALRAQHPVRAQRGQRPRAGLLDVRRLVERHRPGRGQQAGPAVCRRRGS